MEHKKTFFEKCARNLAYRIITVILVTVVPLCLVTVTIAFVTLRGASEQMHERMQRQTEANMDRLEETILQIEDYAEEFVNEYIAELNAAGGFSDELVPYDMIGSLQRLFSHTGLKGAVYLVYGGGCMVRSGDGLYAVEDIEALRAYAGANLAVGFESFRLNDHELMRREYAYPNARAGFVVDIPASITAMLPMDFTEETISCVRNGEDVFRHYADGSIELMVDGTDGSGRSTNIVWQGRRIPLSVSIYYPWTIILGGIPTANWLLVLLAAVFLLLTPLIWRVLKKDVLLPIEKLTGALQKMRQGDEGYRINEHGKQYADEMLYLFESFDAAAEEVQRSKEKDVKMVKAELDNLRLQVNPHMLLNSYNMIFALAQSKKFDTIQEYSLHLVNYFRYVLRKTDELVPVKQEMDFILHFIDIQKIRFPNAFRFTYKVGKGCGEAMIPPLLIENFVENSLKYALIPGELVEVMVDIQHVESQLHIAVSDTGSGIKPEVLEALNKGEPYVDPAGNRHIGIWNCMRRVEVFYGEKASLSITSQRDNGTSMILKIPFKEAGSHEAADR